MHARRTTVVVSAVALLLTGGPLVMSTPGASVPAAAEDRSSPSVFVNEIHYANAGVDSGEFVEIAGPSGTDLSGSEVVLYDGETGAAYATVPLTESLGANGTAVVGFPVEGIQDRQGALALVSGGDVSELLSWGGTVAATDGPAAGMTSTDVGITEGDDADADSSLQRAGTGAVGDDFTWRGPMPASPGTTNEGQVLTTQSVDESNMPGLVDDAVEPGDSVEKIIAPSDPIGELYVEGESLAPSATGTPVISQNSSGNLAWSGGRQLRVNALYPSDAATVTFSVPLAGRYVVAADLTAGQNFGESTFAIDGEQVLLYNGFQLGRNVVRRRVAMGEQQLAAGDHTLTMTAVSTGGGNLLRIGLDALRLRLQPSDARLMLSPAQGDKVAGDLPVYGWSTDRVDQLHLQVDGEDAGGAEVADWPALADTATVAFEARNIDAGEGGADFRDGVRARGHDIVMNYDVNNDDSSTSFVTNGIQVSGELLRPGTNTVTFFAGQDTETEDPNYDDFDVRNLSLVLADGTVLKDTARPDGTVYRLGDSTGRVLEVTWTFTLPDSVASGRPQYDPGRGYLLDSSTLDDGSHSITLVAEGPAGVEKLHRHITVDNGKPVVTGLQPADGALVKGDVLLDASVSDSGDPRLTVDAYIDTTPVRLGDTISSDDLVDGKHTFTVTAVDAAGNATSITSKFTSVGETPDAPQLVGPADGDTVPQTQADLKVRVTDPAGERLRVDVLQATQAGPPVGGRSGESGGTVPAPSSGSGTTVDPGRVAASDDVYVDSEPSGDIPYQQYDVAVSKVRGAKTVDLSWEGRVAADRDAVLSVWNVSEQAWHEVATARGSNSADTTLVGSTRLGPAIDGDVVHVLVQARDAFPDLPADAQPKEFEDPSTYDFSIAWMTDTQYLSEGGAAGTPEFGATFQAMNDWIVANAAPHKIVYAAHTGDVINNWQVTSPSLDVAKAEFGFASKMMVILDDSLLPNGVLPGNHDNRSGADPALFNEYFGPARYQALEEVAPKGNDGEGFYGAPWQPGNNENHYDLVEIGGQRLIFVYLGYLVGSAEIAWANQVLADHRDRSAVVLTHSYLLPSLAPDGRGGALTATDGEALYEQVVVPNQNVFLVLSGHTHGVGLNVKRDVGEDGRMVVEMMANHQFFELPGDQRRVGHFRLLQVDLESGRMAVNTYSPKLDDHNAWEFDTNTGRQYLDSADEFAVPLDLPSRTTSLRTDAIGLAVRGTTVIGSADIESGETATVTWDGLTAGTGYSWYARATDPTGASAESSVFSFVTSAAKQ
jgi:hypothetical protein